MKQCTNQRRSGQRRSGITLLECIATLSVLMVLAMAATKILSSVTTIGLQTNHDKMSRVAIERLSAAFRQDVLSADKVTVDEDGSGVTVYIGEGTVQYSVQNSANLQASQTTGSPVADLPVGGDDENMIYRSQQSGGVAIGKDRFMLTQRCRPDFSQVGQQITLRLTPVDDANPWIIQAVQP